MADSRFQDRSMSVPTIDPVLVRRIVEDGDARLLDEQARGFGYAAKAAGLTKSQIRGIFGSVRQIKVGWDAREPKQNLRQVLLLKPRLAYQGAREPNVRPLAGVLSDAIDSIAQSRDAAEQTSRFGYFVDLFEAILAYHTAAGGK